MRASPHFAETGFCRRLVEGNGLVERGFEDWLFRPGMLFGAMTKWWGTPGKRETPHEGLDLCLFLTQGGTVAQLDETIQIPAIWTGTVTAIIDDFLAKTIVMEHEQLSSKTMKRLSLSAHLQPLAGVIPGQHVEAGEMIGTIASTRRRRSRIAPHLHLSVGLISSDVDSCSLTWTKIARRQEIQLLDPLGLSLA
jgi:hypothetical protein